MTRNDSKKGPIKGQREGEAEGAKKVEKHKIYHLLMWLLHLLSVSDEDVVLPILTGHTRFIYYLFIFLFFLASFEYEEMPYGKKVYCGRLKMQKEEKKFLDFTHTVHTAHRKREKKQLK